MIKVRVRYMAEYDTVIEVNSLDDVIDTCDGIQVPENDSIYVDGSFEIVEVTNETGDSVDYN